MASGDNWNLVGKPTGVQYGEGRNFWGQTFVEPKLDQFVTERYNIDPTGFQTPSRNWLGTQAPTMDTGQSDQVRQQQMALAQALQGQAAGTAPSIAQNQLQAGTDANIAQQMAMAQSGRGNPALAQRLAMTGGADAQQAMAGQASLARLQEQQGAQNLLSSILSGTRGQDITGAQSNLAAATDILKTGMGAQSTADQANLQAALQREALKLQEVLGSMGIESDIFKTLKGGQDDGGGFWSGLGSMVGGIGGLF